MLLEVLNNIESYLSNSIKKIELVSCQRGTYTYKIATENSDIYAVKFAKVKDALENEEYDIITLIKNEANFLKNYPQLSYNVYVCAGVNSKYAFLCKKWIFGETIKSYLNKFKENEYKKNIITLMDKVLTEIHKLHEMGFVHGDLQSSHIIVENHTPKLIDFGLTHRINNPNFIYRGGMVHFNSPQICKQLLNRNKKIFSNFLDEIYSIGSVFYFIHTGKTSTDYGGKPMFELEFNDIWKKIINEPIHSFKSNNAKSFDFLENILMKCLKKNPKNRFQNCYEIQRELKKHHQQ